MPGVCKRCISTAPKRDIFTPTECLQYTTLLVVLVKALAGLTTELAVLDERGEVGGSDDEVVGDSALLGLFDPAVSDELGSVETDKVEELEGLELVEKYRKRTPMAVLSVMLVLGLTVSGTELHGGVNVLWGSVATLDHASGLD